MLVYAVFICYKMFLIGNIVHKYIIYTNNNQERLFPNLITFNLHLNAFVFMDFHLITGFTEDLHKYR